MSACVIEVYRLQRERKRYKYIYIYLQVRMAYCSVVEYNFIYYGYDS